MANEGIKTDCTHMKGDKCKLYWGTPIASQCANCYAYVAKDKDSTERRAN